MGAETRSGGEANLEPGSTGRRTGLDPQLIEIVDHNRGKIGSIRCCDATSLHGLLGLRGSPLGSGTGGEPHVTEISKPLMIYNDARQ